MKLTYLTTVALVQHRRALHLGLIALLLLLGACQPGEGGGDGY